MIRHIIFDLGGVIVDYDKKKNNTFDMISVLFNLPKKKAIRLWDDNRSAILQGDESLFSFLKRLQGILGDSQQTVTLVKKWEELSIVEKNQVNWELVTFIDKLKDYFKLYLFSDTIDTTIELNGWLEEIINQFDGVFISYRDKFKKPDNKAFSLMLGKIQTNPQECLLIDDLLRNIRAARALGMYAIRFKSNEQLKKKLAKYMATAKKIKQIRPLALTQKSDFFN